VHLYRNGREWHLADLSLIDIARGEQAEREQVDPWEELLTDYTDGKEWVSAAGCFDHLGIEKHRRSATEASRIATLLRRMGFELRNNRVDGKKQRRWYPVATLERWNADAKSSVPPVEDQDRRRQSDPVERWNAGTLDSPYARESGSFEGSDEDDAERWQ
jgi:predicted P-loop ATPase